MRDDLDNRRYEIEVRTHLEGWTPSLVRELAGLYRPRIEVNGKLRRSSSATLERDRAR